MWLSDLRVVLPDRTLDHGALRIEDGRIAEVIASAQPGDTALPVVQCSGLTAIPGIIDLHGDMIEREIEPRAGVAFPVEPALLELDKRLAAAGVTTAYAAISFHETGARKSVRTVDRGVSIVRAISRLRGALLTDLRVHARFEITHPVLVPTLAELLADDQVQLLSLTDHTPGQGQYRDIERFIDQLAASRNASRADVAAQIAARVQHAQDHPLDLDAVAVLTQLAQRLGVPIASHDDDTPERVALVARLGATISEFPVTLAAARAARQRGMPVVMGAPNALRGESHSGNLHARDAIAAGVVNVLAADYYPAALLHAAFALARSGELPLHAAVAMITHEPAAALGLRDCGSIAVGMRADLALVEDAPWPRVRATFCGGVPVYTGGWPAAMAWLAPEAGGTGGRDVARD